MIVTGHIPSCASGKVVGRKRRAFPLHRAEAGYTLYRAPSSGGWQAEWPTMAALIEALASAVQAMAEAAAGLTVDPDAMQTNMDATEGAVLAERATFLLAEKMGKRQAGELVEAALAKGGSFVEALGQLEKELLDEMAPLGYSPRFVDRLCAELRCK